MEDGGRSLGSSIPVHLDKTDEEIETARAVVEGAREEGGQ